MFDHEIRFAVPPALRKRKIETQSGKCRECTNALRAENGYTCYLSMKAMGHDGEGSKGCGYSFGVPIGDKPPAERRNGSK